MSAFLDILNDYLGVFVVSFIVTIAATPIMRRIAISQGIIDRPDEARKQHKIPIAYLGGVGVFLGMLAGIAFAFLGWGMTIPASVFDFHPSQFDQDMKLMFPVILGMAVITVTGLIDDVVGLDPRLKIVGQLFAAAALAMQDIGTELAAGVLRPIGSLIDNPDLTWSFDIGMQIPMISPTGMLEVDLVYWTGTGAIAVFVLGACNASNLIDGLDGLLSGVTAIAAASLTVVAIMLAMADDSPLDGVRIVLALALLGGCMGFLPHNFNPASIFLGDTGSLLLGYMTIVLVLSLGQTGQTHLVIAGLIIYSIPIIDTTLAIVRRKLAGKRMSDADDQHLHHMLKRTLGVKGAVLTLYAIGTAFGIIGVWLTDGRVRVVFTVALVMACFIGVYAVKVARKAAFEAEAQAADKRSAGQLRESAEHHSNSPEQKPANSSDPVVSPASS